MKRLGGFKYVPYQGYMRKEFTNKLTEIFYFLVKHISKCINSKKLIALHTQRFKSKIIEKEHANETTQSVTILVNNSESKSLAMCIYIFIYIHSI